MAEDFNYLVAAPSLHVDRDKSHVTILTQAVVEGPDGQPMMSQSTIRLRMTAATAATLSGMLEAAQKAYGLPRPKYTTAEFLAPGSDAKN